MNSSVDLILFIISQSESKFSCTCFSNTTPITTIKSSNKINIIRKLYIAIVAIIITIIIIMKKHTSFYCAGSGKILRGARSNTISDAAAPSYLFTVGFQGWFFFSIQTMNLKLLIEKMQAEWKNNKDKSGCLDVNLDRSYS